jgi:hypothetical protein
MLRDTGAPHCGLVRRIIQGFSKSSHCELTVEHHLLSYTDMVVNTKPSYLLNLGSSNLFDLQQTLRMSHSRSRSFVCAWVYVYLGMHETATDCALTFDIALARTFADLPDVPSWLKMALWLGVAKHIINDQSLALSESLRILDKSPLLSLEEILPLFPDFVVIDTFKPEISGSIECYDRSLKSMQTKMAASMGISLHYNAQLINGSFEKIPVRIGTYCALSGGSVLTKPFQCFPSGLVYFPDVSVRYTAHYTAESAAFENCFLTGNHMIDSIDIPFSTEHDGGKC